MSKKLFVCYLLGHFWVDMACAFLVAGFVLGREDAAMLGLCYNFCAFALQLPLGPFVDAFNRNHLVAAAGCVLTASAFALPVFPAVCAAGIGNSLFHLGGGVDVLNASKEKMWKLGTFISPGAIGLYLGTVSGSGSVMPVWPVALALVFMALLISSCGWFAFHGRPSGNAMVDPACKSPASAMALVFLVVAIRSYMALASSFEWKADARWAVASVLALAFGKAAGGVLADRFGIGRTSVVTLGAAAVSYLVAGLPVPGVAATFLFNMTMPLTMWMAAGAFPGAKGMAFGALAFSLFVGYLPVAMGLDGAGPVTCAAVSVVSIGLLLAADRLRGKANDTGSGVGRHAS